MSHVSRYHNMYLIVTIYLLAHFTYCLSTCDDSTIVFLEVRQCQFDSFQFVPQSFQHFHCTSIANYGRYLVISSRQENLVIKLYVTNNSAGNCMKAKCIFDTFTTRVSYVSKTCEINTTDAEHSKLSQFEESSSSMTSCSNKSYFFSNCHYF